MQVKLSGGNYGGQVIEWPEGEQTHVITDDVGTWTYDITTSRAADEAVLANFEPMLS